MTLGGRRLAATAAALVLLAGCSRPSVRDEEPAPTSGFRAPGGLGAVRDFRSVRGYRATPLPVRVDIPGIGVTSFLERLDRARDGTVQVPRRWDVPGWYAAGPRPGDPGSAVILGHVDSRRGPAVFYRLRELGRGDEVRVTRDDGSRVRFVVQRTAHYEKRLFPTQDVYYPTLNSTLRLVTCAGQFDRTTGHYRSNIIVFATMRT
jgi:hypothetical protein